MGLLAATSTGSDQVLNRASCRSRKSRARPGLWIGRLPVDQTLWASRPDQNLSTSVTRLSPAIQTGSRRSRDTCATS
jgi:hypothetical protein